MPSSFCQLTRMTLVVSIALSFFVVGEIRAEDSERPAESETIPDADVLQVIPFGIAGFPPSDSAEVQPFNVPLPDSDGPTFFFQKIGGEHGRRVVVPIFGPAGTPIQARIQSFMWIGAACQSVDPTLRSHLDLPEDVGITVIMVAPESVADKGGLKQHDILLKAGERSLKSFGDLMEALELNEKSKKNKLDLRILRNGKQLNVTITPGERPKEFNRELEAIWKQIPNVDFIKSWVQSTDDEAAPGAGARVRVMGPAIVMNRAGQGRDLPGDVSVSITKQGNVPATIVVQKGDKKWEVKEGKLDELPASVRPFVHQTVGGLLMPATATLQAAPIQGVFKHKFEPAGEGAVKPDQAGKVRVMALPNQDMAGGREQMERLEKLGDAVERLQRQVEALRKAVESQK